MFTNTTPARSIASSSPPLSNVLVRIRSEYDEMPGLCLTRPQAARLWGLDSDECTVVLHTLVETGYLKGTAHGFVRA